MDTEQLNRVFAALADPTRRAIIERLATGTATAGELAEPFGISKPAISRHLKVLEQANLIVRQKAAQHHLFQLKAPTLSRASAWIDHYRSFWEDRLDALGNFLNPYPIGGNDNDNKRN